MPTQRTMDQESQDKISYQPPSQPTSPITRYAPPKPYLQQQQQQQQRSRNGAAVFEVVALPWRSRNKEEGSSGGGVGQAENDADETVIVSLPSPRGCLLEAEEDFGSQFQTCLGQGVDDNDGIGGHDQIRYVHPQRRGHHRHSISFQPRHMHSDDIGEEDPYFKIVRPASTVESTNLDDHREQEQQKKKQR
ncbi:hypothetical protein BGZ65_001603 [Modicella reniformis]|uniref:Uncharacterized protein n=1 Tax=Modicella reniformis TaxID=1440133 RepID=A0A9P6M305_9FUNG|nr:hypothetical protein BGZ65_001603 [Modicella reniformis]